METVAVGSVVRFEYPTHNRLDLPDEWLDRRVLVCGIENRWREPLDVNDFLRRPMLRRGATLIVGLDCDLPAKDDQGRRFYFEAIRGEQLPGFQLGLYDPAEPADSIEFVGRVFWPTLRDRLLMQDAICLFQHKMRGKLRGLKLGAYAVEG